MIAKKGARSGSRTMEFNRSYSRRQSLKLVLTSGITTMMASMAPFCGRNLAEMLVSGKRDLSQALRVHR